ncbi:MAG: cytochrome c biogenesis protein ResB [Dehalococcoidia bacterium]|nr:cytochrome c biogenesis protein ResB [Dehalococcoidia bacterium]
MAARTGAAPGATLRPGGFDPLRTAWQLLTNVKFALLLVGVAGVAAFLGVVLPQVPVPMRSNPAARSAWIELRREDFGILTGPMDRLELFEIFYSAWFNGLWFLVIAAVTVCTVSRLRPTARAVHRPHREVPDRYFETAHHRADFAHPGGAAAIADALRGRRYRVETTREADGATYLFAERFQWSQYGTFVSHLALLMLLVGGVLTRFAGYDDTFIIAEGQNAPVFESPGPSQIFVRMVDSYRGLDDDGNIIDYHSRIEVTRGGETIVCKTTVNDPCPAFGYKVHQAAFFNDMGHLRVIAPDGRTVEYDGLIDFNNETTTVPHLRVTRGGELLFDRAIPQFGTDPGATTARDDDYALAPLILEGVGGGEVFEVAWRVAADGLRVVVTSIANGEQVTLGDGVASGSTEGFTFELAGAAPISAIRFDDMPGAGASGATLQMADAAPGETYVVVAGVDGSPVTLTAGEPYTTTSGYTYTFGGRVEASGVSIRRDPGDTFIWIAVAMAMVGLAVTFYVPRRRLWVKVTPTRTYIAGIAEKTTRLGRELRHMGASLGSRDALRPEDREE